MRIKKILVPINYSECSMNALRYAGKIAKKFESNILILHALDDGKVATSKIIEEEKTKHIEKISSLTDNEPDLSSILTDILVTEKAPREATQWAIEVFDIDLIIIGTDGVHKPFDELVGSFTFRVVDDSKIPVLTIPNKCAFMPFDKIGLAVDYKLIEHTSVLDILLDFVYAYKSKLEIFHIKKYGAKPEALKEYEASKLDDYFEEVTHTFETIEHKTIADGIKSYIKKSGPDLLVIMPRKYKFFEWLRHSSVAEEAVQHLELPVLTIPQK